MNFQNMIFDLDGTLWNSVEQIRISWNEVLDRHPEIKRAHFNEEELGMCMGKVMTDIVKILLPDESEEVQLQLLEEMCEHENKYLSENGGVLYPGVKETIVKLSENHNLFIVSNCQSGYIEAFIKAYNMENYFKDIECWGNTKKMKHESIRILMDRNSITDAVYIGDTDGDGDAAHKAGLPFVFAAYGFGDTDEYEEKINSFFELEKLC